MTKRSESQQGDMFAALTGRIPTPDTTPATPPPAPTPSPPASPPRPKVRTTVDLPADLHHAFQMWATERGAKMTHVYLSLARRLLDDPTLATQVEADLRARGQQRSTSVDQ